MNLKIKKGLDLHLAGGISADVHEIRPVDGLCAVCPEDFPGFKAKTLVKEGDIVSAGQPLLFNKDYESMTLVSPATGRVRAVVRGDRRRILRVEVEAQGTHPAPTSKRPFDGLDAAATVEALAKAGLLARFRQRPYDIVPQPGITKVRDIYVMAFDAAPLAVSAASFYKGETTAEELRAGAEVLKALTDGKLYIAADSSVLKNLAGLGCSSIPGAEIVDVGGPYPSSLAGTVIAATRPINKGETVWTLDIETMRRIGRYSLTGSPVDTNIVAVTGSEVKEPFLARTPDGISLETLLEGKLKDDGKHKRIISGNVLTGVRESLKDGFLRFPYSHVTVIPEGDDCDDFMGWASLAPSKISAKASFPLSGLTKLFTPDARLNGGRRAMIMSGEYEKYMPMDILPEYLIKAILAKDIESMERLGIYEVAPEDFALAEFADTSKLPLQQIVRDGLDYLRKELS